MLEKMSPLSLDKFEKDGEKFSGIPKDILEFIQMISFEDVDENFHLPNEVFKMVRKFKATIDSIILKSENRITLNSKLDKITELVEGFFMQAFLNTENFITVCDWTVCDWNERKISNNSFKDFTWKETNPTNVIYGWEELARVKEHVDSLIKWEILWYRLEFSTAGWKRAWWVTVRVPFTSINIRFWFEIWNNKLYRSFFKKTKEIPPEELVFHERDFYFLKKVIPIYKEFVVKVLPLLPGIERDNFHKMFNLIFIKALILDFMIKFNPNPAWFYKWSEPVVLSESFLKITWYTWEEIMLYYTNKREFYKNFNWPKPSEQELDDLINKYWNSSEITTLIYKWEGLQYVMKKVSEKANNWWGYDSEPFILTHRTWLIKIKIPWTNHIYIPNNDRNPILSIRTWNLWGIEFYKGESNFIYN